MKVNSATAFSLLATLLEQLHEGIETSNTTHRRAPLSEPIPRELWPERPRLPRQTRIRGVRQQAIATQLRVAYLGLMCLAGRIEREPGFRLADGPLKGVPAYRRRDVVNLCHELARKINRLNPVVPHRGETVQVATLGGLYLKPDFKEAIELPYRWADAYLRIWRLQGTVRQPTMFSVESTQRRGLATLLKVCRIETKAIDVSSQFNSRS